MLNPDIHEQCRGKWASVLINLGFPENALNGKHQPCPFCNAGKDRFRWDKNKEFSFCSTCGNRNSMEMAINWLNKNFKETAIEIRKIIGDCKLETIKYPDIEKRKERLAEILKGCKRITADTVAARYFASRCITEVPDADCFFHPALDYFNDDGVRRGNHPAIVSRIRTPEGEISSFQVLYLTDDGKKLNAPDCRKILPTIAPMSGGAIRLYEATDTLNVCEGVENALAIFCDTGIPTWSLINAGNMDKFTPPKSVKHIFIYADEDKSGTGAKYSYSLFNRLKLSNKFETVCVVRLINREPYFDYGDSFDYNDWLVLQSNN